MLPIKGAVKPSLPKLRRSARNRTVTGLEIEPGVVRAVQAHAENGRLVVETAASAALAPGVVRDGEVVEPEVLAEVLSAMFEEHKLDKNVRIGVANQRVVVRHMLLPQISDAKELQTALHFMAADELPMPIDQAVLDHVVLGPADTPEGPRTRVLLVAARRSMIESLLSAAAAAGLRPAGVDLAAFAMVRALGADQPGATLHLAVGGVVNLAVTRDGECVFTRVVAGGMETMAAELAERQAVTVEDARLALQQVRLQDDEPDSEMGPDEARAVLVDGLRRIAGDIRNSIDFHLGSDPSMADGLAVERVLLTGSALTVGGFADALSSRLSLPVEPVGVDVDGAGDGHGTYAVAAGLAVETVAA